MSQKSSTTDAQTFFDTHKKKLLAEKDIIEKKMFGTIALCVKGKVFMFPWKNALVFKLPENKVEDIIASKKGKYFDPGHGRTSKTWVAMFPNSKSQWPNLVRIAKEYVILK